jgi:hypothetical protein
MEKVNLTIDLDTMKKKLQEVAAAEKRSAAGSYLVTGVGRGYALGGHSSGVNSSSSSSGGGSQHASRVGGSSVTPNGAPSKSSSSSAPAAPVSGGGFVLKLGMME